MKKKILTGLLIACSAAICFAAVTDITGKWKSTLKTDDGNDYPLTYNFKVDGDKLTGNIETTSDNLPINDGKIQGDSIHFSVDFNGGTIPNKGRCYADSIVINTTLGDATYHMLLTRAK